MKMSFFVPGRVAPAGSKSAFINKKSNRVMIAPASKYTKGWMKKVTAHALMNYRGPLLRGPISLTLLFKMHRPLYHLDKKGGLSKEGRQRPYPITKPDLTKIIRSTEDALTGIIWKDDSQVISQSTCKQYCDIGEKSGVLITVETIDVT